MEDLESYLIHIGFQYSELKLTADKACFDVARKSDLGSTDKVKVLIQKFDKSQVLLYRIESLPGKVPVFDFGLVAGLNRKVRLGKIVIKNDLVYLTYAWNFFNIGMKSQALIKVLPRLVFSFFEILDEYLRNVIETLSTHVKKLNFPSSSSSNNGSCSDDSSETSSESHCEVCNYQIEDCTCSNFAPLQEKTYQIPEEILSQLQSSGLFSYFDHDLGFFIPESCEYFYNPSSSLTNQIQSHSLSRSFVNQFFSLIQDMKKSNFYFRHFPFHLFQVTITNNKIKSFALALVFPTILDFRRIFTSTKPEDFQESMKYKLIELCIKASKKIQFNQADFISIENFENPDLDKTEVLGSGGFASVHLNRTAGRQVAVKIPHLKKEDYKESMARVQSEFAVMKSLSHKNVVKALGVVEYGEKICIVMKYYNGVSLKKKVQEMSQEKILDVMKGIASGMFHMHRAGIVHQDLKPANVILVKDQPKIIDLGLAVREKDVGTSNGFTFEYSDPQQIIRKSPGKPADVWSFGVMFVACLVRGHPYAGVIEREVFTASDENKFSYLLMVMLKRPAFWNVAKDLQEIFKYLIESCMNSCPANRPSFFDILKVFNKLR